MVVFSRMFDPGLVWLDGGKGIRKKEKGTLLKTPSLIGAILFECCSSRSHDDNYDVKLFEPETQRSQATQYKGNISNFE